jgi:hypothetical protein
LLPKNKFVNFKNLKYFNNSLAFYLTLLFILSVFYLFYKHNVANDSTISEWLINYTGGFTKRGLIGQSAIYLSRIFDINLRIAILIEQITIIGIYYFLLFFFLKGIFLNRLYLLVLFSPIFLLYPVYEIETLGRKEIFIFSLYILNLSVLLNKEKYYNFSKLIIFTLSVLIWEPIIFFLPMWIFIDIMKMKKINLINLFNELIFYVPGLIIAAIFVFNPLDIIEHSKMALTLKNEFGERCYMSCALLKSKSGILVQITANFHAYNFENIIRYIIIILIGFFPLFSLMNISSFSNKRVTFSVKSVFIILLLPIIFLFLMGYDWGRWVNITYTITLITFIFLYKKKLIFFEFEKLTNQRLNKIKSKYFYMIFIIYCFTWSPKTVITDDVGSFPLYRSIYKMIKILIL